MRNGFPHAVLVTALLTLFPGCNQPAPRQSTAVSFGDAHADAPAPRRAPIPVARPTRAIWVARYHYATPESIRAILDNCAASGVNTVLWQVRGAGTVAYPSRLEPWSEEYGFRDPGFDPLALAVRLAHERGMRIEPWINVTPGWRGLQPPPIRGQLYHARPKWFLADGQGRRQALTRRDPLTGQPESVYVLLNPCLPEVREHIASLAAEIVSRYEVDGLHLDYVRYAWDTTPDGRERLGQDPRTLALYRQASGQRPADDREAWDRWRAEQLTRLVRDVRERVDRLRPGASLTAAVWGDPRAGRQDYLQNAVGWLRTGLLDAAMPMAYAGAVDKFEADIRAYRSLAPRAHLVPGVGLYLHVSRAQTARQLARCEAWGGDFALFSYDSLWTTSGQAAGADRIRAARLDVLRSVLPG